MKKNIYDTMVANIKSVKVATLYTTRTSLLKELNLKSNINPSKFDEYLAYVCDYTTTKNISHGNVQYIIHSIFDTPKPYIHGGYIEDETFLIDYNMAKKAGVYVIYAYDEDNTLVTYVGGSLHLRRRFLQHKSDVKCGRSTKASQVLAMKGAKVDWLFLANDTITKEKLKEIEQSSIYYFKRAKWVGLSNILVNYTHTGGVEGTGKTNWSNLIKKFKLFTKSDLTVLHD